MQRCAANQSGTHADCTGTAGCIMRTIYLYTAQACCVENLRSLPTVLSGAEERGVQRRSLAPFLIFSIPADLRSFLRTKWRPSMQYKVRILRTIIQTVIIFNFLAWHVPKKSGNSSLAVLRHLTVLYTTMNTQSLWGTFEAIFVHSMQVDAHTVAMYMHGTDLHMFTRTLSLYIACHTLSSTPVLLSRVPNERIVECLVCSFDHYFLILMLCNTCIYV